MKGYWGNDEVKALFREVEKCLARGENLKKAIENHAKKYSRACGSVRNYYYGEISRLKGDETRLKKLGIDLSKHSKNSFEYFSKEEEDEFYSKIKDMVAKGMSVRKACFNLANGDGRKMLRYQNKYRTLCKNICDKKPDNIIQFKKRSNSITDSEIQALFAGLVRLVKRSAQEDAEAKIRERSEQLNSQLRKTMALLGEREHELEKLKGEILIVKKENEKLLQGKRRQACLKVRIFQEMQQSQGKEIHKNV